MLNNNAGHLHNKRVCDYRKFLLMNLQKEVMTCIFTFQ